MVRSKESYQEEDKTTNAFHKKDSQFMNTSTPMRSDLTLPTLNGSMPPIRRKNPPTIKIVMEAIKNLDEKKGTSYSAIRKWTLTNYPEINRNKIKFMLSKALVKGLRERTIDITTATREKPFILRRYKLVTQKTDKKKVLANKTNQQERKVGKGEEIASKENKLKKPKPKTQPSRKVDSEVVKSSKHQNPASHPKKVPSKLENKAVEFEKAVPKQTATKKKVANSKAKVPNVEPKKDSKKPVKTKKAPRT